jgi:hypothetical protein
VRQIIQVADIWAKRFDESIVAGSSRMLLSPRRRRGTGPGYAMTSERKDQKRSSEPARAVCAG